MPNTVENFERLRRKDIYMNVVDAATKVPETSRDTLEQALYLFSDDIEELNARILHLIAFAGVVNTFVLIAAVFSGSPVYIACTVAITMLTLYLNNFRASVAEVLPAAQCLAESRDNGPPYTVATGVFWY